MADYTQNLDLKQQGFIFEARDKAAPAIAEIPENRTLYMGQFTEKPPTKPEMTYELETMEDVFAHFKPEVKIEYQNAEGGAVNEPTSFNSVGDFNPESIVDRSAYLSELSQKAADHQVFAQRLQSNRPLQAVLQDPEKKEAYLTILKHLIEELERS